MRIWNFSGCAGVSVLLAASGAGANNMREHSHHHAGGVSADAPIGVMGSHSHGKGGWMIAYRYMHMEMDGMRDGTDNLSSSEVLTDYMVTPERMSTDMHMLGGMYGVSDELTLTAMVPYIKKGMDHVTRMGGRFTTKSEGFGDVQVGGLYTLRRWNEQQVHLNLGLSMPTGDIDETGNTPAMQDAQLPYPMQLGSGTWDFLPGITYLGQDDRYSWGAQAVATVRTGDNDNGYTLGDRLDATTWGAYQLNSSWSGSARLRWQTWGNIDGQDDKLNPMMVPTADPDLQGGTRADALLGVSFLARDGAFKGQSLAVEGGVPVYENLDGPQMSADWMVTVGWQLALH